MLSFQVISETSHAYRERLRPGHQSGKVEGPRVVCYYTNWAQYRQGKGKYDPTSIKSAGPICTHIHYALAKIENGELKPYEWNDPDHDELDGNFRLVTNLKKSVPGLKVLLSVGGWNKNNGLFSRMVHTPESWKKLINSLITLLNQYNFDGLD